MENILHIFNGDVSADIATKAGIEGNYLIWRELLCEGDCEYNVKSENFIATRSKYFKHCNYASSAEYKNKFISQFNLLDHPYEEITLWFEHDLFCQINMLAALSLLFQQKLCDNIFLICVGDSPRKKRRMGLGEFSSQDFPGLYNEKTKLEYTDFQFADKAWKYYCEDMIAFDTLSDIPVAFSYLAETLATNRLRFTLMGKDISALELNILELIHKGSHTERVIVRELLKKYDTLGYGDLQYSKLIEYLSELYTIQSDDTLLLNATGKKILSGLGNTDSIISPDRYKYNEVRRQYVFNKVEDRLNVRK